MSDFKYGSYTVQQRWDMMLGTNADTFTICCRAAWLAFAVLTASAPTASYYIAPHLWAIAFILYYWYPA